MLEQVEWGDFRLGDLFESSNGDFDIQKSHINGKGEYVITAGLTDNGILGKTEIPARIFDAGTITIDMFGCAFYRQFKYKIVTHARVFSLKPKFTLSTCEGLFLANSFHFLSKEFGYENMCSWAKIENKKIQLPTKNGKIDFAFMDKFIAELEKIQQAEINSYLEVTGLKNYALTNDELKVLEDFENGKIEWKEFKIEKVLDRMPQKEIDPLKIPNLRIEGECKYPFYGQSTLNNGVISYEYLKDSVLNNSNGFPTILIHSNNQNVVYLESPFYLKDGHGATSVLQKENLNKLNAMFIITVISKIIKQKFSYQTKATKIALKNTEIKLPVKDNQPDYKFMETFISAVHKLVIKDLVLYNQERLKATAQVINKKL